MATDPEFNRADSDSLDVWAPVHAWRALEPVRKSRLGFKRLRRPWAALPCIGASTLQDAPASSALPTTFSLAFGPQSEFPYRLLGQLQAEAAVEPLMRLFYELDTEELSGSFESVMEEMPEVYGLIGPAAIPALTAYLADESHGLYPRTTARGCIEKIGKNHPDARAECVAVLTRQREQFDKNDPELNGFLVGSLLNLKAVESASVIEGAFAGGWVDEGIVGDWEDAQIDLGLKFGRERPRVTFSPTVRFRDDFDEGRGPYPTEKAARAKKAKRKQAKLSRRINRKKRKRR